MNDQVLLGMVDGHIPFVLSRSVAEFRCSIPVLPGGDSATEAPLEARTARCTHRTIYLIGSAPTCEHHIRAAVTAFGSDEWWDINLRNLAWPFTPCPPGEH